VPTLRRWIAAIYAAKLSTAARDTLFAYAVHMRPDGTIQVARKEIQEWTQRPRRNIDLHIRQAIDAGLLQVAARHNHGKPATYRATIPGAER
jgi:hypothetical protein